MADTGFVSGKDRQHTLLSIFLRGGADGLNMVVPVEDDTYYHARKTIGVRKQDGIALDTLFALHPLLAPLEPLYKDGHLLVMHQAGSEDETRSHFEAQDLMEHGGLAAGGWLGRWLRALPASSPSPLSAVALGRTQPEVLRGAPAAVVMESFDEFALDDSASAVLAELAQAYRQDPSDLGKSGVDMLRALDRIDAMRRQDYRPQNDALYPTDTFGVRLRQAAQLIRSNVGVDAITIDLDGWDSHFATATLMEPLMRSLASGLLALYRDLGPVMEQVTVVVMSEFGRRVRENASFGTDHGRGGVMFALGASVAGGRVMHDWRGLGDDRLEGPGDLPVCFNYRNVLAAVFERRYGKSAGAVFPGFDLTPLPVYG